MANRQKSHDAWRTARELRDEQFDRVAPDCERDDCDGEAGATVDGEDLCGSCAVTEVRRRV